MIFINMKKLKFIQQTSVTLLVILIIVSCNSKKGLPSSEAKQTNLKYAEGFSVRNEGNVKFVTITNPYPGATSSYQYLLVPVGESIPTHDDRTEVIRIPIKKIVCTSTTHIPLLDYLNETDALIGFPTTDYISSVPMRKRVDAGLITDLGIDKGMNVELLYSLSPELVMSYTMTSDLGQLKKVKELGIPVVINAEFLEKHPLGRAEWIKFMALFFNKEKEADSVFNEIEKRILNRECSCERYWKKTNGNEWYSVW
jgi:iron complex transport system substrate-binding protein